jgi:hypothetical protein
MPRGDERDLGIAQRAVRIESTSKVERRPARYSSKVPSS